MFAETAPSGGGKVGRRDGQALAPCWDPCDPKQPFSQMGVSAEEGWLGLPELEVEENKQSEGGSLLHCVE